MEGTWCVTEIVYIFDIPPLSACFTQCKESKLLLNVQLV
jgi:hypothetical protein